MGRTVFLPCCLDEAELWAGIMEVVVTSFKRTQAHTVIFSAPDPPAGHCRPMPLLATDSWTLTGKSGSVSCVVTAPFSWVLLCTRCCLCPPRVSFPSPVEVLSHWPPKSNSLGVLSPFAGSSGWEICCGSWNFLNNARISAVCGLYAWQLYDGDNGNLL